MAKVLVADDEPAICEAFSHFLRQEGHTPLVAADGEAALAAIDRESPAVVFLDVRMPGRDGLSVLAEIAERWPRLPVIVMTAFGTVEAAVTAMRLDAFDYVGKPLDLARLRQLLGRALARSDPADARPALSTDGEDPGDRIVGQSPAMQEVFKQIGLLARNEMSVLVQGESGSGKELIARSIHAHGRGRDEPFVAVNCAAMPDTLIETELFGHEKGAFTDAKASKPGRFELAGAGTLFLDEISELSIHLQSKLLRVLQEREFERVGGVRAIRLRARLVAATNRDLQVEVENGRFREDLFHRLNLARIVVPPLRDRREDIEPLARYFLARANAELDTSVPGIGSDGLACLYAHDWPGNVRELEHGIKRGVMAARTRPLGPDDMQIGSWASGTAAGPMPDDALREIVRRRMSGLTDAGDGDPGLLPSVVAEVEDELIRAALEQTGGNQVAAARLLGISRTTLRARLAAGQPADDVE